MTLQEKLYDLAAIDALPPAEEMVAFAMEDYQFCRDAIIHYLHFNPNKWDAMAQRQRVFYN